LFQAGMQLPLQVLLFFNGWYDVLYTVIMLALYIWKGTALPYPGALQGLLALEICVVFILAILEACRIFLATRGNKTERPFPLILAAVLCLPCGYGFFYFLYQQVYVTRADLVINAIGLGFIGLELLLSLGVIVTLSTGSSTTQVG
jgi:transmembrane protein 216